METKNKTEIVFEKNKISTRFDVLLKEIEGEGMVSCYIPGFNLFFSASSKDVVIPRAQNMVRSFLRFWTSKREDRKTLFLELHKLGFRAENHSFTLKNLMNQVEREGKFGYFNPKAGTNYDRELETDLVVA